jgi:lambda repressor-like predicted transcriptional regulator
MGQEVLHIMRQKESLRNSADFSKYRKVEKGQGAWIGYQLKLAGITHKDIAQQAGVHPVSVTQVIHGIRTSGKIQKAVAQALGYDTWSELLSRFVTRGVA